MLSAKSNNIEQSAITAVFLVYGYIAARPGMTGTQVHRCCKNAAIREVLVNALGPSFGQFCETLALMHCTDIHTRIRIACQLISMYIV